MTDMGQVWPLRVEVDSTREEYFVVSQDELRRAIIFNYAQGLLDAVDDAPERLRDAMEKAERACMARPVIAWENGWG